MSSDTQWGKLTRELEPLIHERNQRRDSVHARSRELAAAEAEYRKADRAFEDKRRELFEAFPELAGPDEAHAVREARAELGPPPGTKWFVGASPVTAVPVPEAEALPPGADTDYGLVVSDRSTEVPGLVTVRCAACGGSRAVSDPPCRCRLTDELSAEAGAESTQRECTFRHARAASEWSYVEHYERLGCSRTHPAERPAGGPWAARDRYRHPTSSTAPTSEGAGS